MRQNRHLAHWEPRLGFVEGYSRDKGETAETDHGLEGDDEGGEGEDRGQRRGVEPGTVSLSLAKCILLHTLVVKHTIFFCLSVDN